MDTGVDLKFADGEYHFALLLPQIFELERNCGGLDADGARRSKSIFEIYEELSAGLGLSADGDENFNFLRAGHVRGSAITGASA